MTVAPLTRAPADPHPVVDPPRPDPAQAPPAQAPPARRRPRLRAPGHEPAPLAAGTPHPRRHDWSTAPAASATGAGTSTPPGGAAHHAIAAPVAPQPGPPPGALPHARAGALVRSVLEVLAGRRQPAQLAAAVTPEVLRYLAASRPSAVRAVVAGRVHVRQPHPDAAEVVAVCRVGHRIRALTLRLDVRPPGRHRGPAAGSGDRPATWLCTAVRLL